MEQNVIRCPWADGDEKMAKYHDEVWGVPVHDDQKLFAKLSLDLMQAGLMWRTILYKQENFEKAFDNFHIETVASYDEVKYEELMQDVNSFDTVFVGFPIWWYVAPTIINTFLESYDFTGKTIVPFATSGSSGMGETVANLKGSVDTSATITDGKILNGKQTKESLTAWVESLGL